jgi:hypothetical protein
MTTEHYICAVILATLWACTLYIGFIWGRQGRIITSDDGKLSVSAVVDELEAKLYGVVGVSVKNSQWHGFVLTTMYVSPEEANQFSVGDKVCVTLEKCK